MGVGVAGGGSCRCRRVVGVFGWRRRCDTGGDALLFVHLSIFLNK